MHEDNIAFIYLINMEIICKYEILNLYLNLCQKIDIVD